MNEDILKGKWKQLKGEVKSQWGKLTDDDLDRAEGDAEKLIGRVQERTAISATKRSGRLTTSSVDTTCPSSRRRLSSKGDGPGHELPDGFAVRWFRPGRARRPVAFGQVTARSAQSEAEPLGVQPARGRG